MTTTEHCIDICNKLLRGERAAVETYDNALKQMGDNKDVAPIRTIRDDHAKAAERLKQNVVSMGGTPSEDSGAWGEFANLVEKGASLFGDTSALESLKAGEKKGLNDYQDALADDEVLGDCKHLIQSELVPPTERHIQSLEQLQKAA